MQPDSGYFRPDPNSWMKDIMVPDENEIKFNCGKQKNVILKQLTELFKRFNNNNGGSDETRQQDEDNDDEVEDDDDEVGNEHQPFTSLLMMQGSINVDLLKDRNSEQNVMWESKPREHRGTQVMFHE